MKRSLVFFLMWISFAKFNAQQITFCPPGAEWHYLFTNFFPSSGYVNETIKYTGNVIVGSDTLKLLTHTRFFTMINTSPTYTTLIKQKGDTVFMKNVKTNSQWQILYNFGAQVNQSWTNTFYLGPNVTINYTTQVTSIGSKQIGNKTVKELSVNYSNSYGSWYNHSGTISEYFGSNVFLFNYISRYETDGDYYISFLCYTDDTIGTTQFTDKPCNFSNLSHVKEMPNDLTIETYPNPVKDVLNIETKSTEEIEISFANFLGREVKRLRITQGNKIDVSDLEKGMYLIQILNKGKLVETQKLVKE